MSDFSPSDESTAEAPVAGPSLVRGTGVIGSLTLVSRVLGFVRDLLVARLFGTTYIAEAFFVAFRIPNLLRSFVAEGALTSAFVPVFATEIHKGKSQARAAIASILGLLLATTIVLSIFGVIYSSNVVDFFAPGFQSLPEKRALCVVLTQIMMPYICFVSIVALLNGALNTVHVYGIGATAQVVMNIVLIVGAIIAGLLPDIAAAHWLAYSVMVGGVAQVVIQIPALKRAGFSLRPALTFASHTNKTIVRLMLPAIVGASVYQISIFLNTLLASVLESGSVAWLFYADRVTQLPLGVFSVALASVLLPTLSHSSARDDHAGFNKHLVNSLRFTSFLIIPLATFFWVFAEPLVQLLFQRGAFTARDTILTAQVVKALSLGLWSISCHSLISRAFIARKDTVTTTIVGALTLLLSFSLALLFMGHPTHAGEDAVSAFALRYQAILETWFGGWTLGAAGLAAAASLGSLFALGVLSGILNRRVKEIPWGTFVAATLRSGGAAAVATVVVADSRLRSWCALFHPLVGVSLGCAVFSLVYIGSAILLKSSECQETLAAIRRLSKRK